MALAVVEKLIKIRVNIELSAETEKRVCCREVDVSGGSTVFRNRKHSGLI